MRLELQELSEGSIDNYPLVVDIQLDDESLLQVLEETVEHLVTQEYSLFRGLQRVNQRQGSRFTREYLAAEESRVLLVDGLRELFRVLLLVLVVGVQEHFLLQTEDVFRGT